MKEMKVKDEVEAWLEMKKINILSVRYVKLVWYGLGGDEFNFWRVVLQHVFGVPLAGCDGTGGRRVVAVENPNIPPGQQSPETTHNER
ncbi:hypothetical protein Pmani_018418 [Petrolisthes manimaculis]|uniref:Uncharacterized protein n=1 Tax=Petrolisthes manimaculis TaxID=1843537 RepID=A0AAE1U8E2_9EUCA|nr:hypothetical protein Pmani_018418 [Petrolisthes manimaculis]